MQWQYISIFTVITLYHLANGTEDFEDDYLPENDNNNPYIELVNTQIPEEYNRKFMTDSPQSSLVLPVTTRVLNAFPGEKETTMSIIFREDKVEEAEYGKVVVKEVMLHRREDFVIQFESPTEGGSYNTCELV